MHAFGVREESQYLLMEYLHKWGFCCRCLFEDIEAVEAIASGLLRPKPFEDTQLLGRSD